MIEIQLLEISFILNSLRFYVIKKNEIKDGKVCVIFCWYGAAEPYLYDKEQRTDCKDLIYAASFHKRISAKAFQGKLRFKNTPYPIFT